MFVALAAVSAATANIKTNYLFFELFPGSTIFSIMFVRKIVLIAR